MDSQTYQQLLLTYKVPNTSLSPKCEETFFSFETTNEIHHYSHEMIGQKRAVEAMDFGLSVDQSGYNIFVAGPSGTGRSTFTTTSVNQKAKKQSVPNDWCYVYNFDNPDHPIALSLPTGLGSDFQQDVRQLLKDIERDIRQTLTNEQFNKRKRQIIEQYEKQGKAIWKELENLANDLQFKIERTSTGINTYPLRSGKPIPQKEYENLADAEKAQLTKNSSLIEEKVREAINIIRKIEDKVRKSIELFIKQSIAHAIKDYFHPLYEKYKQFPKVHTYLNAFFQDVVKNYSAFVEEEESEQKNMLGPLLERSGQHLTKYEVNLFVNNKHHTGAPVIYETNPTYQNLFGKIEYRGNLGSWTTDFTQIKTGSLHLANGGYLIIQAAELLQQPNSWNLLKRMLRTNSIFIENPLEERTVFPMSGLKPEPIPLKVKIILIGSYYLYDLLSSHDEDFYKLFKVKVEFDTEMDKSKENRIKMAEFIKTFAENEKLLPFHRSAIAKIIDYSSRLVESQDKLSTRFQQISKLLVESNYWAMKEGASTVNKQHIVKALAKETFRTNRIAEKFQEMVQDGSIMLEVTGEKVGQINGLAVIGTRDYSFGIPSKITAQTYVGSKAGIMNIERETSLSGQIHDKGILILTGFLSGTFAQKRPLPFSASITFEQNYNVIDGDSASSTELYVLLSSLASIPIKQSIAVTGSVNQWGEIQPIGGVNEKIEGFFAICKMKGLSGEQGVIIPKQNIKNLMLDEEVVTAIENKLFHVWAISHITEGMEILTGVSAGSIADDNGNYPKGTIFYKVSEKIEEMYQKQASFNKKEST